MRNIKFLRPGRNRARGVLLSREFSALCTSARIARRRPGVLFNNAGEIYARSVRLPSRRRKSTCTRGDASTHFRFFLVSPPSALRCLPLTKIARPPRITNSDGGFNRMRYRCGGRNYIRDVCVSNTSATFFCENG